MAGDQVTPPPESVPAVRGTTFLRCEACRLKVGLQQSRCPRCGGALLERDLYDVMAAACRQQEERALRREMRFPMVAGAVVLLTAVAGVTWALVQGASKADVKPASIARAVTLGSTVSPQAGIGVPDGLAPAGEEAGETDRAFVDGDLEGALAGYRHRLADAPDDLAALNNAAQALVRLARPAQAVPLLERAADIAPHVWMTRFNLARALGETGRWTQAADHYRVAADLMPGHYPTLFNLGLALQHAGADAAAAAAFAGAVEADANQADAWLALGAIRERLGRPAEARAAFERYLQIDPDSSQRHIVEQRLARGAR
jgi:Flp pilus assembly protein TadD